MEKTGMETLKYARYMNTVAEMQSFSKAAAALYISQPSLSAVVKKVEKELGFLVFDRTSSPISLTPSGRYYISQIKKILELEQEIQDYCNEHSRPGRSALTIGASSYFCAHVLPALIETYESLSPDAEIITFEANTDDLINALKTDTVDLLLDADDIAHQPFRRIIWKQESLILAVPASCPSNLGLESCRLSWKSILDQSFTDDDVPSVSISAFAKEPFLSLKQGSDLYSRSKDIFRNAGIRPQITMYLDQLLTAYYIAREGRGICFIRSDMLHYTEKTDRLNFYKIADPLMTRNIYLYYRPDSGKLPAIQNFLSFLGIE